MTETEPKTPYEVWAHLSELVIGPSGQSAAMAAMAVLCLLFILDKISFASLMRTPGMFAGVWAVSRLVSLHAKGELNWWDAVAVAAGYVGVLLVSAVVSVAGEHLLEQHRRDMERIRRAAPAADRGEAP